MKFKNLARYYFSYVLFMISRKIYFILSTEFNKQVTMN